MLKRLTPWAPSPAMIVAVLALCLSLGGVSVAALKLKANSVKTKHIKAGAVTNPKIGANAVDGAKLTDGAVSTAKILDNAIDSAKIADNAVDSSEIAADSVAGSELAPDAVTGDSFFRAVEVTVDPPSISAEAGDNCTALNPAVNGVDPGDHVFASPEALNAGLVMFPLALSADQVQLRVCNLGQNLVDQGSIDVFILVVR